MEDITSVSMDSYYVLEHYIKQYIGYFASKTMESHLEL